MEPFKGASEGSALGKGPSSWEGKVTVTAPPSLRQLPGPHLPRARSLAARKSVILLCRRPPPQEKATLERITRTKTFQTQENKTKRPCRESRAGLCSKKKEKKKKRLLGGMFILSGDH